MAPRLVDQDSVICGCREPDDSIQAGTPLPPEYASDLIITAPNDDDGFSHLHLLIG
jgi:hypothetical protein